MALVLAILLGVAYLGGSAFRSLTPVFITHSIYHVFGEPFLLMMALIAMNH
jgi:hypothetical protein